MKDYINSPFYLIKNNKLFYLDSYEICKLPTEEEIRKKILLDEGALFEKNDILQQEKTVLVLEPHPDDFALSALGYVLNRYNAIIGNIFTKTKISNFPWINYIHINENKYEKLRIEESILSIEKLLNQHFITLAEESLRISKKKYKDIKKQILKFTQMILNENNIEILLVPMGIGDHPDHLIIHNTIMNNYNIIKSKKIILYPEYPYARCKKSYIDKLNEIENKYNLKKIIINVDEGDISLIANAISIYRSQFDDINRNQMLGIIREDFRSLSQEYNQNKETLIYFEVLGDKK